MRVVAILLLASGCELVFELKDPAPQDGANDGAPIDAPATFRYVFVTSTRFSGNLSGLEGADEKCESAASAAGLGGTFKAWLSTNSVSAANRHTRFSGPYHLVNDTVIALDFNDLIDGAIEHPIDLTENGTSAPASTACGDRAVWTDTSGLGVQSVSNSHCNDWTSGDTKIFGAAGNSAAMDMRWTEDQACNSIPCNVQSPIYCIQQ
ncbi:MAG: hypothetical protein H0V17_21840 [Deltaproteobacteria bacterium]|nr:hypothetical protein [Deltaproteobacteria bacterium]